MSVRVPPAIIDEKAKNKELEVSQDDLSTHRNPK
jgi:hypothetical protein